MFLCFFSGREIASAIIVFICFFTMALSVSPRDRLFRKPVRITITLPYSSYLALEEASGEQGRSMSNLAAYLLEGALGSRG